MRSLQTTTRRIMIAVAAVALPLGGFLAVSDLERRSALYHRQADYHGWKEEHLRGTAAYLESLAGNPARTQDLLNALDVAGTRWRDRAIAARLESMESETPGRRWYLEASDAARKRARVYRLEAEYHGRQKRRYAKAAFDSWTQINSDPAGAD